MPLCFLIKCKKEESLNKRESTCQYLFFLKLIGSLVLLIYGMKTVSEALQKLTGGHLRHILGAMTTNRFTGLLTGALYSLPLQQIVSLEEDEYHLVDPNKSFNIENERNNYRNQLKDQNEGGNLAASKIRNLECPSYEICLIDYGCGKFNRKIHIMEQYP